MITISTDMNAWKKMTEAHKRRIKSTATEYVRKKTLEIFTYVLKQTPQLTGTLVQNWTLVVGSANIKGFPAYQVRNTTWPAGKSPYISYNTNKTDQMGNWIANTSNYESPRAAGDPQAIKAALSLAVLDLDRLKWNSKILITNTAEYAYDLTQPDKTVGWDEYEREFEFRNANVAATDEGMLEGEIWNIKPMTIMRFKYLGK